MTSSKVVRFKTTWTKDPESPITDVYIPHPTSKPSIPTQLSLSISGGFEHEKQEQAVAAAPPAPAAVAPTRIKEGHQKGGASVENKSTLEAGRARANKKQSPLKVVIPPSIDTSDLSTPPASEDDNEFQETAALEAVSQRKQRTIRDTNFIIYYFTSVGSKRIRTPPQIPMSTGILPNDIYIHRDERGFHAWRCTAIQPRNPRLTWVELPEGTQESIGGGKDRIFVITETGMPGWVVGPTIDRKYKRGSLPKTPAKQGKKGSERGATLKKVTGDAGKGKGKGA